MNALQRDALGALASRRSELTADYPNHWVAVNPRGQAVAALRFDLLVEEYRIDPESVMFAFLAAGPWA